MGNVKWPEDDVHGIYQPFEGMDWVVLSATPTVRMF